MSFSSHIGPPGGADLRFVSYQLDTSLHCKTTDIGVVHRTAVPVYAPAFAGTHFTYPRRDGEAELTWTASYTRKWFIRPKTVTHPGTNRAQRSATIR